MIAYGLMALMALFVAVIALYAWYHSYPRRDARRRLRERVADDLRLAARQRER